MQKRLVGGGIVVGALALAWLWSGLNRGPGGGDSGTPDTEQSSQATTTQPGNTDLEADDSQSPSPGHGDRLTVLISGGEYKVARDNEYVVATLGEIIDLVRQAPDDEDGIRVRILHDRTGVSGAQSDLERALGEAGLSRDQWQTVQQPVE